MREKEGRERGELETQFLLFLLLAMLRREKEGELYILLVLLLLSLLFLEVEASGLSLTQGEEALGMTAKGHIHQQYNELLFNHLNTSRKNKADFISFLKMKILLGNLFFC